MQDSMGCQWSVATDSSSPTPTEASAIHSEYESQDSVFSTTSGVHHTNIDCTKTIAVNKAVREHRSYYV